MKLCRSGLCRSCPGNGKQWQLQAVGCRPTSITQRFQAQVFEAGRPNRGCSSIRVAVRADPIIRLGAYPLVAPAVQPARFQPLHDLDARRAGEGTARHGPFAMRRLEGRNLP